MKIVALWNGTVIAESERCVIVEGNYYFPPQDLRSGYFRESSHRTVCVWKGEAHYYDLVVGENVNENAAWYYPEPGERLTQYRSFVAFWRGVAIERAEGKGATETIEPPRIHPEKIAAREPGESRPDRLLAIQDALYRWIQRIPKTEIHLHLEAIASAKTIFDLMCKHKSLPPGIKTIEDLYKKFQVTNLTEFVDLYMNYIQPSFRHESDFAHVMADAQDYFVRNNVDYAEVFFAPTRFLQSGMRFERIIRVLDEAAQKIAHEGIVIRFIVDVSRSFGLENAMNNLDLTLQHRTENIIGIGLGGSEKPNPARLFRPVFEKARANGLRTVAHAGEEVGPESIREAISIGAERIGHGISAMLDESLMSELAENRIPIECCPTSNVFTRQYIHSLAEHPIRKFYDRGMCVTVNTDDPTIFSIELADEYMNILNHCGFSSEDLPRIIKNGIDATFMPAEAQASRWQRVEAQIRSLGLELAVTC